MGKNQIHVLPHSSVLSKTWNIDYIAFLLRFAKKREKF